MPFDPSSDGLVRRYRAIILAVCGSTLWLATLACQLRSRKHELARQHRQNGTGDVAASLRSRRSPARISLNTAIKGDRRHARSAAASATVIKPSVVHATGPQDVPARINPPSRKDRDRCHVSFGSGSRAARLAQLAVEPDPGIGPVAIGRAREIPSTRPASSTERPPK